MSTRRGFLASAAGLAVAGTALPAAAAPAYPPGWLTVDTSVEHPDKDLLALCTEAAALTARSDALIEGIDPRDGDAEAILWREADDLARQSYDLRERASLIRATTFDGMRAKAAFIAVDLECNGIASEMALSLADDLLAGSVGA